MCVLDLTLFYCIDLVLCCQTPLALKRIKEHQQAVETGNCVSSAVAEHTWGHHHPIDWNNIRVLEQHSHLHHRLALESIHIRSQTIP